MRTGSFLSATLALPLIAASPQPVVLAPSGPWVLDYANDSCRLSRVFGSGKTETVLQFESTAPGELSMIAIGKPLDNGGPELGARFAPLQIEWYDGETRKASNSQPGALWSNIALLPDEIIKRNKKRAMAQFDKRGIRPPPIDLAERNADRAAHEAFAGTTTSVEFNVRRNRPVVLATGPLGEAIRMFDKCTRDSLKDWGVNPDLEDQIVRPVWAPDPALWFTSDDYPNRPLRDGKDSEVRVRLLVDAAGNVSRCTSLSHFDEPEFNKIVCDKFMKRAKFAPAEISGGKKVPSYYINRVVFRLDG